MDEKTFSQIISPDTPIDEPRAFNVVALIFGWFMTIVILVGIGFISFEFYCASVGKPLNFGGYVPSGIGNDVEQPVQYTAEEIISQFKIVSPAENVTLKLYENITIICRWSPLAPSMDRPQFEPKVLVDNVSVVWKYSFGYNIWVTTINFAQAGEHRIWVANENRTVNVISDLQQNEVTENDEFFPPLYKHRLCEDEKKCTVCHDTRSRDDFLASRDHYDEIAMTVRTERCFQCHIAVDFEFVHRSLNRPTLRCADCHSLHGTSESFSLLKERKQ
ncbi:MAG: cytochrome c3 family protein [Planctomycetaceae bacterium]|jgi:hypothetical protein|nr:cytochrome c3 family protein [Planctomycetaceae bacterium]